MKVAELKGPLLDVWVASCADPIDVELVRNEWGFWMYDRRDEEEFGIPVWGDLPDTIERIYRPSYSWGQGGPIIEREKIATTWAPFAGCWYAMILGTTALEVKISATAETPLLAAMRAYVASKHGEDLPSEVPIAD